MHENHNLDFTKPLIHTYIGLIDGVAWERKRLYDDDDDNDDDDLNDDGGGSGGVGVGGGGGDGNNNLN